MATAEIAHDEETAVAHVASPHRAEDTEGYALDGDDEEARTVVEEAATSGIQSESNDSVSGSEDEERDESEDEHGDENKDQFARMGLSTEDAVWVNRLKEWLDCFSGGYVHWGKVVAKQDSYGHQRQHHGIVIVLSAQVAAWIQGESDKVDQLLKLREAIGLVQLLVLIKPAVIGYLIRNIESRRTYPVPQTSYYEDELHAMMRGVPVQLRVEVEHSSLDTRSMKDRLATYFFHDLSQNPSSNPHYIDVWADLLTLLVNKIGLVQCNGTLREPVRVVLSVDSCEIRGATQDESELFFRHLARCLRTLHTNQQQQQQKREQEPTRLWVLDAKHAALVVEKIDLRLKSLIVTPRIVQLAKAVMKAGIPVNCARVAINPQHIVRHEQTLRRFVATVATGEMHVVTNAHCGSIGDFADRDGRDERPLINMVIKAIASIPQLDSVDVGGLLKRYGSSLNRDAVWCGLFTDILSRTTPIDCLLLCDGLALTEDDAVSIEKHASQWRHTHPNKKLRVPHVHLDLWDCHAAPVQALLSALDDVERLSIEINMFDAPMSSETLPIMMRFPSLRHLSLETFAIQTMDVFDPESYDDPSCLPHKPTLEDLELRCVTLEDQDSLRRFIAKLKPDSKSPSALSTSLRRFELYQKDKSFQKTPVFDHAMVASFNDALHANRILESVRFGVDLEDPSMYKYTTDFQVHNGRHVPASRHHSRHREIVKARKLAFLSVIRDSDQAHREPSARFLLDTHVVQLILAFSAPHVYRMVGVGLSMEEEEGLMVDFGHE